VFQIQKEKGELSGYSVLSRVRIRESNGTGERIEKIGTVIGPSYFLNKLWTPLVWDGDRFPSWFLTSELVVTAKVDEAFEKEFPKVQKTSWGNFKKGMFIYATDAGTGSRKEGSIAGPNVLLDQFWTPVTLGFGINGVGRPFWFLTSEIERPAPSPTRPDGTPLSQAPAGVS